MLKPSTLHAGSRANHGAARELRRAVSLPCWLEVKELFQHLHLDHTYKIKILHLDPKRDPTAEPLHLDPTAVGLPSWLEVHASLETLQGYLAHKNPPPLKFLQ